ncbi:MAG: hypothetical protein ACK4NR_01385 [Micavibrio sp.]
MAENKHEIRSRRGFLKAALTGAALGLVTIGGAQVYADFFSDPCSFGEGNRARQNFLADTPPLKPDDVYGTLMGQRQFTFFGDTNHTDMRPMSYFYSPQNQERMIKAGIRHIFIEHPTSIQPLIDDIASGKIGTEDALAIYNESMNTFWLNDEKKEIFLRNVITFTANMAKHGIKVHAVDEFDNDAEEKNIDPQIMVRFAATTRDMVDYKQQSCPNMPVINQQFVNAWGNRRLMIKKFFNQFPGRDPLPHEIAVEDTRQDDNGLASRIKRLAGDEKAAILYGAAHAHDKSETDLDELLGSENVLKIDLVGNRQSFLDPVSYMAWGRQDYDEPHFIHLVSDNQIIKTYHGQNVFPDQKTSQRPSARASAGPA